MITYKTNTINKSEALKAKSKIIFVLNGAKCMSFTDFFFYLDLVVDFIELIWFIVFVIFKLSAD